MAGKTKKPLMRDMAKLWNAACKLGDVKVSKYYESSAHDKPTLMCIITEPGGNEEIGIAIPPENIAKAMQEAIDCVIKNQERGDAK